MFVGFDNVASSIVNANHGTATENVSSRVPMESWLRLGKLNREIRRP